MSIINLKTPVDKKENSSLVIFYKQGAKKLRKMTQLLIRKLKKMVS